MKQIRIFLVPAMFSAFVSLLSCGSGATDRKVQLDNAGDSISFAVSMLISQDMPAAMSELGIDASVLDDFVRGLCDAFPVEDTPEARAYAHGVVMAASAMDMLERADKAIYPDDTINKVDRKMFLEGLIATAYGTDRTMSVQYAKEYYNQRVFRNASDEFIKRNKERRGVVTLPSGLQYRIEEMGTGAIAGYYDTVNCIYKGSFPNGAMFDSSRGEVVELQVRTQIQGLAEALITLPVGTVCKLYIPWELAYGEKGTRSIPPYSALVYDLEIKGIAGK